VEDLQNQYPSAYICPGIQNWKPAILHVGNQWIAVAHPARSDNPVVQPNVARGYHRDIDIVFGLDSGFEYA
jgi:hypothetical protein